MITTIKRTLVRTAAAVCFAASFAVNAGGVFYQSDFDPLGFAGSAKWYVDDNCKVAGPNNTLVLQNGYHGVNLFAPGGCDVALAYLSVSLWKGNWPTLKDATDNLDNTLTSQLFPTEMLSVGDNPQAIANPVLVAGIWVVDHELAGIDTFLIGPQKIVNSYGPCDDASTSPTCIDGYYGVQFTSKHNWLAPLAETFIGDIFPAIGNLNQAGAYLWERDSDSPPCATPVKQFWWATFSCASEVAVTDNTANGGYAPFVISADAPNGFKPLGSSFDGPTVPEPGSLALLGGALVAGWLTRRRKLAA